MRNDLSMLLTDQIGEEAHNRVNDRRFEHVS
jgi:hypothetical protein